MARDLAANGREKVGVGKESGHRWVANSQRS